ncbi:uncharacterized protein LOC124167904 isoform X2 [Ischnura elegans]|uniref:uncharacterized protein LOC124167904 isoform X2 n=1 Tax=Ischnura elegans TaxID=197161 RepID=UPI001ED8A138|nr:uncharacterized protein LOC124167904 isoform X2 [Ischnura elegans]
MDREDQAEGRQQQPSPYAPKPPVSETRRGAEAADDHMGPSSEGDTAPEPTLVAAGGTEHAQYHSHIPPGFSLIVNDVDAEKGNPQEEPEEKASMESSDFGVEVVVAVECDPSLESSDLSEESKEEEGGFKRHGTLTHSSSQKELSDARIKQIQGEVESRKNEFARLLEEHAQVVKQLKAMEEEEGGDGRVGRQQLH